MAPGLDYEFVRDEVEDNRDDGDAEHREPVGAAPRQAAAQLARAAQLGFNLVVVFRVARPGVEQLLRRRAPARRRRLAHRLAVPPAAAPQQQTANNSGAANVSE